MYIKHTNTHTHGRARTSACALTHSLPGRRQSRQRTITGLGPSIKERRDDTYLLPMVQCCTRMYRISYLVVLCALAGAINGVQFRSAVGRIERDKIFRIHARYVSRTTLVSPSLARCALFCLDLNRRNWLCNMKVDPSTNRVACEALTSNKSKLIDTDFISYPGSTVIYDAGIIRTGEKGSFFVYHSMETFPMCIYYFSSIYIVILELFQPYLNLSSQTAYAQNARVRVCVLILQTEHIEIGH